MYKTHTNAHMRCADTYKLNIRSDVTIQIKYSDVHNHFKEGYKMITGIINWQKSTGQMTIRTLLTN
jgi:hypothetical protein